MADDREALVETTADVLGSARTVEGDDRAWEVLTGLLDLDVTGFAMHMR
ncbi:hypothetical protein [Streptomyces parvulus]